MPAKDHNHYWTEINLWRIGGHLAQDLVPHVQALQGAPITMEHYEDVTITAVEYNGSEGSFKYTISGLTRKYNFLTNRSGELERQAAELHYFLVRCPDCGKQYLQPRVRYQEVQHCRCRHCELAKRRERNRRASKNYRVRNGLIHTPLYVECHHCGKKFQPKRSTAKFCSDRCRVANHRTRLPN